jgi:uncharacterized low-complexity protein
MAKKNKKLATLILGATLMSVSPVMGGTSTSSGCGAGRCGAEMKKDKDAPGSCGAKLPEKKPAQMACGAGKCGADMMKEKDAEGSCGAKLPETKPEKTKE